ncbi:MAG: biopolymer transporter ExbD, partial [Bacteroidetes bacterium]|nr:biopolymer transporter ExbD [Bacteroidota bacterium]
ISDPNEPLVISIDSKGVIYIQKTKIAQKNLISHLETAGQYNKDVRVFIRANKNLRYSSRYRALDRSC